MRGGKRRREESPLGGNREIENLENAYGPLVEVFNPGVVESRFPIFPRHPAFLDPPDIPCSATIARRSDLRRLRMSDHKSPTASIRAAIFFSVNVLGPIDALSSSSHVQGADTGAPGFARTA